MRCPKCNSEVASRDFDEYVEFKCYFCNYVWEGQYDE